MTLNFPDFTVSAKTAEELLALAYMLSASAHLNQRDKGGRPYIEHPMRLAGEFYESTEKIVALLHDVIEDAPEFLTLVTLEELGYPDHILRALDALTHRECEEYTDYIARVNQDPLAWRIKVADLYDNLDMSRLPQPLTEWDIARNAKYHAALKQLREGR